LAIHCRGVAIEFCSVCRGVFLDKGEREKLTGRGPVPAAASHRRGPATGTRSFAGVGDGAWLAAEIVEGLLEMVGDL
jgi:Zn-finger nucleic acid-binding protein